MDAMQLAVVVGAGGMGAAVARALAADYRILLVDIDEERSAAVADEMREAGAHIDTAQCDVTSPGAAMALADRVEREGGMRVLAHVAGLSPTMGNFDSIIRVNLVGPALVSDALLPHAVPGAAAILISSLGAHLCGLDDSILNLLRNGASSPDLPDDLRRSVGDERADSNLAYQLSKFGLIMLARRRAGDWGARGARILSLSPGMIATPMGAKEFAENAAKRRLFDLSPQKREGTMEEIADVVAFLASDKASFLSGTDILVDGGVAGALSDVPFDAMRRSAR